MSMWEVSYKWTSVEDFNVFSHKERGQCKHHTSKKARQYQKKYNSNSNKNLYNKITMKTNYLDAQNISPNPWVKSGAVG